MILVTLTINGTIHKISDEYCELTNLWEAKIKSLNPVSYMIRSNAGGFCEPQFGDMTLVMDLFENDWPPPNSCTCVVYITDTTEEAATIIFNGTAHLSEISKDGVKYSLHGQSYALELSNTTWIDDTLENVFTTYCGGSYLNLTLNTTYARASSPRVHKKVESGIVIIDMLSEFAESTNHLFYIKGSTLYLVDMLLDNGTDITVDEFDFFPVVYSNLQPIRRYHSKEIREYTLAGTYGYGEVEESAVASNIEHLYMGIGNNSGNDTLVLAYPINIAYEGGKYYMIKVKFKQTAGTGTAFAGFQGIASDGVTYVDRNGGISQTLQHWAACRLQALTSEWSTYTGYASGRASTGETGPNNSISDPLMMQANVAFIRPLIQANYNVVPGITFVDFVGVYEVDSDGDILEELFYHDFTTGFGCWEWVKQQGEGERGIYTSLIESQTNMATHLGNRKTILEAPRAIIKLPLEAQYMANPGQKISWVDESVVPDDNQGITQYIRVRQISFDLTKFKVIYEGEGGRS